MGEAANFDKAPNRPARFRTDFAGLSFTKNERRLKMFDWNYRMLVTMMPLPKTELLFGGKLGKGTD